VLNKHKEATFKIPDITKVLTVPDLLKVYMQPAINAIGIAIEQDLLSLYPGMTSNAPLGAAATPLTESVLDSVETTLFKALVPPGENKYLITTANDYSNIRQIPRFSEYRTAGEAGINALINGQIGKLKDLYILRSQYVQTTGTGTLNNHSFAFTKDALALVMRRLPQPLPGTGAIAEYAELGNFGVRVVMSYDPQTLAQQFTVDVLYGVANLREVFSVQVNS
jgi:hypothetical protein